MSRVTLKEIAEKAGVSTMTVSRALRNQGRTSKETIDRIQQIAQELGYIPDPRISELMSHMRDRKKKPGAEPVIAYLSTEHRADQSPAFPAFFQGANQAATELGYKLDPLNFWDPSMSDARMSDILEARGIEGVLIPPTHLEVGSLNLTWSRLAAVAFGSTLIEPDLHRVLNDHYHNTLLALEQLEREGMKSVGILLGSDISKRLDYQVQSALHVYPNRTQTPMKVRVFFDEKPEDVTRAVQRQELEVLIGTGLTPPPYLDLGNIEWCCLLLNTRDKGIRGINIRADLAGEAALRFLAGQLLQRNLGVPTHPLQIMVKGEWSGDGSETTPPDGSRRSGGAAPAEQM